VSDSFYKILVFVIVLAYNGFRNFLHMDRDEFKKFINNSRELIAEDLDFKKRLEKVLGAVADRVVKDKYVNENDIQEVSCEDDCERVK